MSRRIEENLLRSFKRSYGLLFDDTRYLRQTEMNELIIVSNDDHLYLFDGFNDNLKLITKDVNNISEQEFSAVVRERLKKAMYIRGYTEAELGELTDISTTMISNYLTGKSLPGLYKLKKLANALEVTFEYLTLVG